ADRAEDVALPLLEIRGIFGDEPKQVALGLGRNRRARALERRVDGLGAAGQILEALLERIIDGMARGLDVLGIALAAQQLERVDVRLERQRGVEHLLDACLPKVLDGLANLARVRSGLLDDLVTDLLLALLEQRVVLREVRVAEHVRGDERVLL